MKKYTILLFDADGTLFDFHQAEQIALKTTFKKYHLTLSNDIKNDYQKINQKLWQQYEQGKIDKETIVNTRFVTLFDQYNIPIDGKVFEHDYQHLLSMQYPSIKGAKDLLEHLVINYRLFIVTNGVASTQRNRLALSGFDKYFEQIFISEEIGYQKPTKEYFDHCFNQINNFKLEETLIIGDSLTSDIQGGINANIDTCWYNPNDLVCNNLKPDYIIKDLHELINILKSEA